MAIIAVIGASAGGGRFVPPLVVARSGLGLSAGQFEITDYSSTYIYNMGGQASLTDDIITLPNAPSGPASSGTVQALPPKGVLSSSVVNVARTPYTYHDSYHHNPKCTSHWSKGQCASWGSNHHYNGVVKNPAPAGYSDSEGEWWRIW